MMDLQLTLFMFTVGPVCSCADASEAPVRENCTETLGVKKRKKTHVAHFLRACRFSTLVFFCP